MTMGQRRGLLISSEVKGGALKNDSGGEGRG